ncbi:MAG TPA: YdcH family protein, partial [Sphingomicrobium sp.]|nr:YdcH family protein [Sphingomicrobium sp.]
RKELAPMDNAQADSIASKHAALHAMIDEEEHRPHPNESLLHQLKKERLRLKDELAGHID